MLEHVANIHPLAEAVLRFQRRSQKGQIKMQDKWCWPLFLILLPCGVSSAQVTPQNRHLVVNGKPGDATVVQINSRTYVDLETLVRIANGSLGFQGNQITLVLPGSEANTAATTAKPEEPPGAEGLTRDFRIAGIETIAQMREWASTMANAIQHGYGVTDNWAADYQAKAANSLRQASASASSDADHSALQLLTNEFQNVTTWSNELVEAKKNMDTAKYSTSPDALRNEPLSQKILACGHFLGTMLGSSQFSDDPSCH
jgi:hypothetical protein